LDPLPPRCERGGQRFICIPGRTAGWAVVPAGVVSAECKQVRPVQVGFPCLQYRLPAGVASRFVGGWALLSGAWPSGGDRESRRLGAVAEPALPGGKDKAWMVDGQRAGQVDRVGAAQGMAGGELAGTLLNGACELDRAGG